MRSRRIIKTLDPSQFKEKEQNVLHLRTLKSRCPLVKVQLGDIFKTVRVSYLGGHDSGSGFPSHSTGYFYFCPAEHNRPPLCASVRFRLASTLEDFSAGEDLKLPNGEVWNRPIFVLPMGPTYRPLYDKIIEDGLISFELDSKLRSFAPGANDSRAFYHHDSTLLYTLSDPFILDVSCRTKNLWGADKDGVARGVWLKPYCEARKSSKYMSPYKGTYPQ